MESSSSVKWPKGTPHDAVDAVLYLDYNGKDEHMIRRYLPDGKLSPVLFHSDGDGKPNLSGRLRKNLKMEMEDEKIGCLVKATGNQHSNVFFPKGYDASRSKGCCSR